MGPVLVFIGPSGSGKSTVVGELHRRGLIAVTPSWTTRPCRNGEMDHTVEHRFISDQEFTALEEEGFFLEVVRPFGLPHRYGLPQVEPASDGRVPTIMVRAPLMALVERHFSAFVTYQIEDSYDRAKDRVVAAGACGAGLGTRLEGHDDERRFGRQLASRVFLNRTTPMELISAVAGAIIEDFPKVPKLPKEVARS